MNNEIDSKSIIEKNKKSTENAESPLNQFEELKKHQSELLIEDEAMNSQHSFKKKKLYDSHQDEPSGAKVKDDINENFNQTSVPNSEHAGVLNNKKVKEVNSLIDQPYEIEDRLINDHDFQEMAEHLTQHFQKRATYDMTDMNYEINYIMSNLSFKLDINEKALKDQISLVLQKFLVEKLDIPYILNFSKGFDPQLITIEDIQKILDLDLEYTKVKKGKQQLRERISDNKGKYKEYLPQNYISFISSINKENELNDFNVFLDAIDKLISSKDMLTNSYDPGFNENNDILRFLSSKIDILADSFCLKTVDLCNNIIQKVKEKLPPNPMFPENLQNPSNNLKDDYERVIQFVASDIANNFYIRYLCKKEWMNKTFINTSPTPSGKEKISIFHPFYRVKNLRWKPINSLKDDIILEIIYCLDNKLIYSKMEIDKEKDFDNLESTLMYYFMENQSNPEGWDIYRRQIIQSLVDNFLLNYFIMEANLELKKNAEDYVKIQCCKRFQEMLLENQYDSPSRKKLAIGAKAENVLSMIIDPVSAKEIFYVFLDENGILKDHEAIGMDSFSQLYNPLEFSKLEDVKILINKINKFYPKLIVIGANSIYSCKLKSCIEFITIKKEEKDRRSLETSVIFNNITVILERLEVPKFYAKEESIYKKEFNIILNQAISLGRYTQDPACEILNVISFDLEKSSFPLAFELHDKTNMLDRMELIKCLKKVAINTACFLGIDLNNSASFPHKQKVLSHFLGKNIADKILDYIKSHGKIENREILKQFLSNNQYDNYACYLLLNTENINIFNIDDIIKSRKLRDEFRRSEERRVGKECRSRWSPYH